MDLAQAIADSAVDRRGEVLSGFVSKHFGGRPMNENNAGLGYRHPSGWMGGAYVNSLGKPSAYFGKEFTTPLTNNLAAGLVLGGVTGYGKPVNALALPELIYQLDKERAIAAGLIPPVNGMPTTLAVQLRKKF